MNLRRGSFRVFSVRGIDVKVHFTFLLLLLLFGGLGLNEGLKGMTISIFLILTIFLCVILHEISHSLVAQRFGVMVKDITLLPIGGVATMSGLPDMPHQELLMAAAGPPVNFAVAFILMLPLLLGGLSPSAIWQVAAAMDKFPPLTWQGIVIYLIMINLLIALFNLLPAFPMDGGRILRASLARKMDYMRATRIAVVMGQVMASLFVILGILIHHPFLFLIGLFVYFGASQEERMAGMKRALKGLYVRDLLPRELRSVSPSHYLGDVLGLFYHSYQDSFPVVEGGRLVGMLTKKDLSQGLRKFGSGGLVHDAMQRQYDVAYPGDALGEVYRRMERGKGRALPVMEEGEVVGLVSMEDIRKVYEMAAAEKGKGDARA